MPKGRNIRTIRTITTLLTLPTHEDRTNLTWKMTLWSLIQALFRENVLNRLNQLWKSLKQQRSKLVRATNAEDAKLLATTLMVRIQNVSAAKWTTSTVLSAIEIDSSRRRRCSPTLEGLWLFQK